MPDTAAQRAIAFATATAARACMALALGALLFFLPGFFTLPPMDRDEPRFAQASKQMIESGDTVDIRFQGEARHKKPIGIYWMQASVVSAAEALGVADARRTIWLYRLPSLAGAVLAVLATFWAALAFVERRNAFIAALLFGATILLGVEARLAKTDAVIAATIAAGMGVLARAWLTLPVTLAQRAVFWIAIAVGILVKGPITPMIPAFAAAALSVWRRRLSWLRGLSPLMGAALCLALIAPWFVLIWLKTSGAFFSTSVGGDMLGKVAAGQEAHGAPPGLYLAVFWLTAWPMAPFAALAAPFAFAARREPGVAFLLAWLVPAWLLFEAVPTKLPHYVLPLYPAIAILIAVAIERGALALQPLWARFVLFLLPAIGALAALAGAGLWAWQGVIAPAVAFAGFAGLVWTLGLRARREALAGAPHLAVVTAAGAALLVTALVYLGALSTRAFEPFVLSPRLAAVWAAAKKTTNACGGGYEVATAGFREPSLVFLTRSDLVITDGAGAAQFLKAGRCRAVLIESREAEAFAKALASDVHKREAGRVTGVNINGGKAMDIAVFVNDRDEP